MKFCEEIKEFLNVFNIDIVCFLDIIFYGFVKKDWFGFF